MTCTRYGQTLEIPLCRPSFRLPLSAGPRSAAGSFPSRQAALGAPRARAVQPRPGPDLRRARWRQHAARWAAGLDLREAFHTLRASRAPAFTSSCSFLEDTCDR